MQFTFIESDQCHRLDCGDYEFSISTQTGIVILKKICEWDPAGIFVNIRNENGTFRFDRIHRLSYTIMSYIPHQIEDVNKQIMDQLQKMYEPGGSEFKKCQEQIGTLLQC